MEARGPRRVRGELHRLRGTCGFRKRKSSKSAATATESRPLPEAGQRPRRGEGVSGSAGETSGLVCFCFFFSLPETRALPAMLAGTSAHRKWRLFGEFRFPGPSLGFSVPVIGGPGQRPEAAALAPASTRKSEVRLPNSFFFLINCLIYFCFSLIIGIYFLVSHPVLA